ncbi:hypothetical protein JN09_001509 [Acholeplasma morum]|uniref:hypothetical protein n=1 Tax=Paracholeplasma morum TaxID=264637 RepID=UPI001956DE75|nr:hypothetical protein [Paracholeplasma morum]MBM7454156.1 hypothetical protein [Paracholeplasma morum]
MQKIILKERDEVFSKLIDKLSYADDETKIKVYEALLETGSVRLISTIDDKMESHSFSIKEMSCQSEDDLSENDIAFLFEEE